MKVLLISTVCDKSEFHPVGLLSIGTYLKKLGHDVMICDLSVGHDEIYFLTNFDPEVVGISALTPFADRAYLTADLFRSNGKYVVIGGNHATGMPEEAKQHADAVVTGDGEYALAELLNTRQQGIIRGKPFNLDEVPTFDYELIDMPHYVNRRMCHQLSIWSFVLPWEKALSATASRGCPHHCIYCHNSFTKTAIRFKNIDLIIEDLKHLHRRYNVEAVHFVDDEFLINKKWTEQLCERLAEERVQIYFSCSARASDITEDTLEFLKMGGCAQISFGFESASQRILNFLEKGTTVEQNQNAIDLCNKHGIVIQGSFMIGSPTETKEEIVSTFEFIKKNYLDGAIGAFVTTPYPGTKLWQWGVGQGIIPATLPEGNRWLWDNFRYNALAFNLSVVSNEVLAGLQREIMTYAFNVYLEREAKRYATVRKIKDRLDPRQMS